MTPEALSWVASCVSLSSLWFYGNKGSRLGPVVGLLSQLPWLALAYTAGLTGLALSSFVYGAIHVRNFIRAGH